MTSILMNLRRISDLESNRRPQDHSAPQAGQLPRTLKWGLLALAAVTLWMPAARAQDCSERLLDGAYGVSGGGTSIGVGPVAFVAVFNFSGDGRVDGLFYQKVNGNNVEVTFTGVYTVDSNCVASVTNQISSGVTATLKLVIVNGGREFYLLNTTAPTPTAANVVTAVGKRRRP